MGRLPVALAAVLALVASAVAFALVRSAAPAESQALSTPPDAQVTADPAHTAPGTMRTLVVVRGREPGPSRPGSVLHGRLVGGHEPAGETIASVVADQDCAPDPHGVSHCLNVLRLDDGTTFSVRHPHRMAEVPCLTPGERVRVVPA